MKTYSTISGQAVLMLIIIILFINIPTALTQKQVFFIHDRDTKIQSATLYGADLQDLVLARLDGALDIDLDQENNMIFWSETGKVLSYNLSTGKINLIKSYEPEGAFTTNITALAIDQVNNKLYWINAGDGQIERADPDGSNFEVVFSSSVQISSSYAMDVDPDNEKIYWSGIEYIRRVGYDGTGAENIITDDIFQPEGVFVDTDNDKLYWADLVGNVIKRSSLDGSSAEDVYSGELENPADVTMSNDGSKLYIPDRGGFGDEGIILEVNTDGSGKSEILSDLGEPIALTIHGAENRLYWLDDSNPFIMASAGIDGSDRDTLISELSSFNDLSLSSQDKKIFWVSSGDIYSADLIGGNSGLFIETNSVIDITIDPVKQVLYWTEPGAIRRVNTDGSQIQDLITSEVNDPDYLSLDLDAGKMFWVDGGFSSDRIKWANLDGSENQDLIMDLDQPLDLSYNFRTGKIYWREGGSFAGLIKRASKDGTEIETIVEDGSGIQSYFVSEKRDIMFWSTRDIFSAASDGSGANEIINEDWQSYSLSVDPLAEKIYWFTEDNDLHVIKRANFDGSSVQTIIEGLPYYIDRELVLYGDGITGMNNASNIRQNFRLKVFPNPSNDNSTIRFYLNEKTEVDISLFDISGKQISSIMNEIRSEGTHSVMLKRGDLPSGVYFIRLKSSGRTAITKLVLFD